MKRRDILSEPEPKPDMITWWQQPDITIEEMERVAQFVATIKNATVVSVDINGFTLDTCKVAERDRI